MTVTTSLGEREPEPGVEAAIAAGMRGELEFAAVMAVFAGWPIILPSVEDFRANGRGPVPILVDGKDGPPLVAVFTSADRIGAWERQAPHLFVTAGARILAGVTGGAGVIINPGSAPATELSPQGVPLAARFSTDIDRFANPSRPLTALEVALAAVAAGTGSVDELLAVLRVSDVLAAGAMSGVYTVQATPIDVNGKPYVGIFTNRDYIRPQMAWAAETIEIPAVELVRQAGPGVGFVINPMSGIWFALHADLAARLSS